jgi:DNA-binding NarL/FixJ family response regulator
MYPIDGNAPDDGSYCAGMESLKLLYVEDDPALRAILAERLLAHPAVTDVFLAGDAREALAIVETRGVDAAILDVSLGPTQVNGFDLGLTLRSFDPDLPIVMFSQYPTARIDEVLPREARHHWSYLRKRGQFDLEDLIATIRVTMQGVVRFDVTSAEGDDEGGDDLLSQLTVRQRTVMALVATGLDARAIAEDLHLAHVSVRRELSNIYKILVPDAPPGTDLRTAAVLAYLRAADKAAVGSG